MLKGTFNELKKNVTSFLALGIKHNPMKYDTHDYSEMITKTKPEILEQGRQDADAIIVYKTLNLIETKEILPMFIHCKLAIH